VPFPPRACVCNNRNQTQGEPFRDRCSIKERGRERQGERSEKKSDRFLSFHFHINRAPLSILLFFPFFSSLLLRASALLTLPRARSLIHGSGSPPVPTGRSQRARRPLLCFFLKVFSVEGISRRRLSLFFSARSEEAADSLYFQFANPRRLSDRHVSR
jgi:hypothetical protein